MYITLNQAVELKYTVREFYEENMGIELSDYINDAIKKQIDKRGSDIACYALEVTMKRHTDVKNFENPMNFVKYFNAVCRNVGEW